jgi:hypothetical protein
LVINEANWIGIRELEGALWGARRQKVPAWNNQSFSIPGTHSMHGDSFSWTWDNNAAKLGVNAEEWFFRF